MFVAFAVVARKIASVPSNRTYSLNILKNQLWKRLLTYDRLIDSSNIMFRRIGGHTLRFACRRPVSRQKLPSRKFSVQTSSDASATSPASSLGGITVELDHIAPRFEVPASQITILDSPSSFYETLKVNLSLPF